MPTLDHDGTAIPLSDEGFLVDPAQWTDDVALLLARDQEGIDALEAGHWAVVRYIRGFWLEHDRAPMIRYVCKNSRLTLKAIYGLFPSGLAQGGCKVAGLPSADGCV